MSPKIVAIDGPAGSGKSTLAFLVSKALGWDYLNTGTLYRLIGFLAQEHRIRIDEDKKLSKLISNCEKDLEWQHGSFFYKKEDLTHKLQSESIGRLASDIGKSETVRKLLLPIQRKFAMHAEKGVIIDGRDIGTVVFPHANLKIFMVANIEARAQRRYKQMKEKNLGVLPSLETLASDIKQRDQQDSSRSFAPLQKAADAIEFDTSSLSIEDCVSKIVDLINGKI